ncbi:hypothetical protein LOZ53_000732 [Ophidiomyces ophidiicola]|nr:hypothetical protein LOZ55_001962 [Ophidiomyces ophidiicola]KAI1987564.1 hypothetical protein LOZ54_003536 [Ophidiomyces ophidiicola]KAI1992841.1 hypothetical protein LOZ51_004154 [Ophidiomyces ophidiicola]KAI1997371.1 hypothetical protein LOZ53_000732 [Ophidiomyces ophidiicola]
MFINAKVLAILALGAVTATAGFVAEKIDIEEHGAIKARNDPVVVTVTATVTECLVPSASLPSVSSEVKSTVVTKMATNSEAVTGTESVPAPTSSSKLSSETTSMKSATSVVSKATESQGTPTTTRNSPVPTNDAGRNSFGVGGVFGAIAIAIINIF